VLQARLTEQKTTPQLSMYT